MGYYFATEKAAPQRGGIYWTDIPYHTGNEIAKRRPALVLSVDEHNEGKKTATVAFISSTKQREDLPTHVEIRLEGKPMSFVLCEHIYTVDFDRVDELLGWAGDGTMHEVEGAIGRHLGILKPLMIETGAPAEQFQEENGRDIEDLMETIAEQRGEIRALERMIEKLSGRC